MAGSSREVLSSVFSRSEMMLSRYMEISLLTSVAAAATADLQRLEASHEKSITVAKFIEVLENTLEQKKISDLERTQKQASEKRAIRPSEYLGYEPRYGNPVKDLARAKLVEDIKQRLLSGRLTLIDALDECLSSSIGQQGFHSFKYKLLCNLFEKKASESDEEANKIVSDYITAIKSKKETFNEQLTAKVRKFIEEKFSEIKTDTFVAFLRSQSNDEVSESESSEAPKPSAPLTAPSLLSSVIDFSQSTYREHKQKGRDSLLAAIEQQLNEMKIDNVEALYKALTLSIGQKGPHSVKFKLIFNLLKDQELLADFGLDKEVVDANFANMLVDSFIEVIEVIEKEKNDALEAAKSKRIKSMLNDDLRRISVDTFVANCRELILEKQIDDVSEEEVTSPQLSAPRPSFDKIKSSALGLVEKSRTTMVDLKNQSRKTQIEVILEKLQAEKITIPEAIYRCLTLSLGQKSAHSFKYLLLKRLFGLNANDDKEASQFVDRVAEALQVLLLQKQKAQHDARMKFARERLAAKLPMISLESLEYLCTSLVEVKFDENYQKHLQDGLDATLNSEAPIFEKMTTGLVKGFIEDNRAIFSGYKMASMRILIEKILFDLKEEKITILDAIQLCLTLTLGQQGEHSFKYRLAAALFGLDDNDAKHARELLDCFTVAIGEMQERMNQERAERVNRMVGYFVRDLGFYHTNFAVICTQVLSNKGTEVIASSDTEKNLLQSVSSLFSVGYKMVKALAREYSIEPILESLKKGECSLVQALHAILTSPIGQQGQHSYKFKLLLRLFERYDDVRFEKEDARSASKLINCFIAAIGKQVEAEELVAAIKKQEDLTFSAASRPGV